MKTMKVMTTVRLQILAAESKSAILSDIGMPFCIGETNSVPPTTDLQIAKESQPSYWAQLFPLNRYCKGLVLPTSCNLRDREFHLLRVSGLSMTLQSMAQNAFAFPRTGSFIHTIGSFLENEEVLIWILGFSN